MSNIFLIPTALVVILIISVPRRVIGEAGALKRFKTEFAKRYCQQRVGPNFLSTALSSVFDEAVKGAVIKPIGNENFITNVIMLLFFYKQNFKVLIQNKNLEVNYVS